MGSYQQGPDAAGGYPTESPYRVTLSESGTPIHWEDCVPIQYIFRPLGNCPEAGMFDKVYGDANFTIKRSVFEKIGGFLVSHTHYRYIGYEDYELLTRLSLHGYALDVIPEVLLYYRHLTDSLRSTGNRYQNDMRVQRQYQQILQSIRLGGLAPLTYGIYLAQRNRPSNFFYEDPKWLANRVPSRTLLQGLWLKIRKHLSFRPRSREGV
jgi:GT2 family glycosyltransferase